MIRFNVTIQGIAGGKFGTQRFAKVFGARTEADALRAAAVEAEQNDCYVLDVKRI